jgi:predicted transcriptional regulator
MADSGKAAAAAVPPVWLDAGDVHILTFLDRRGPTYHINVARALPHDIEYVSRRCKDLAAHGLLERRSRTYYALTERGERFLEDGLGPDAALSAGSE